MPGLDKGSGMQNILSAKGTKPAASSDGGGFNTILKQTTAGRQNSDKRAEAAKTSDAKSRTEDSAARDKLKTDSRAEEKSKTEDAETQAKTEETEEITDDAEVLEKAGGEMVAALAAQMGISEDAVREAMDALGMTDVSLLDAKNLKSLMVELTEGADDMSLLTDGDFYQSVMEALGTLEDIAGEVQEETGMSQEEFNAAVMEVQKRLAEEVPEEVQEVSVQDLQEGENTDSEAVKLSVQKPELTENARTETVAQKDAPKQEDTGKNSESPFMGNSYQAQNVEQQAQVLKAAEAEKAFSMTDTQEIMDQILDYMKVSVKPELTSLEMQLHPESLGTLHIQISNKEGAVTAQFIAQNESVRAVLESQMMELRENLEQQGVKVEAVEVTIAQYSLDRNPDGNEASSDQGRRGRKGVRNLNLGEIDLDEEEDLTEEERLTAEMMQSEGSTVNYMA
jgi:flagellar hook-length control protein FliK